MQSGSKGFHVDDEGVQRKEMPLLVAINRHVKNKLETREEFSAANGTYENVDVSLEELAKEVSAGHTFCGQHSDGWRNKSNFTGAGFLAVDIDDGLRMEEALAHPYVQEFAGFLYTTPSHTEEDHRFRIVFELDEAITERERMELALTGVLMKFGGDKKCRDACRQFFGNTAAIVTHIGKRLPRAEVDALVVRATEMKTANDGADNRTASRATVRSSMLLDADVVVVDHAGNRQRLVDLPPRTSIHCPVHVDRRPSAFTVRSQRGTPGVHCMACSSTFFIRYEGPYYDFDYDLRVLRHKSLEEWELEQDDDPYFAPETKAKAAGVRIVNEKYLSPVDTNASVIFVKSPKGSGKTEWLKEIAATAKRNKQSVLLIGHRRSLILSTAKRLGLTAYIQMVESPDTGQSTVEFVSPTRYYAVCVDSLHSRLQPAQHQYDVVIIDEVEQVMSHLTASTLREHRRASLSYLGIYLKRSKKLYLLDADLNRVTVTCVAPLIGNREQCLFLFNEHNEKHGPLNCYSSKDQLVQVLHDHLEEGRRCFVCSNSKELVDKLTLSLQDSFGESRRFKLITSENSQSADVQEFLLKLPDSILEFDAVLVSPAVGTGIDITFPGSESKIDSVFGFFQPRVTTHFDIDQQLCRVRHPGSVHVWISPQTFSFETHSNVLRREVLESSRREIGVVGFNDDGSPQYLPVDETYAEIYSEVKSLERASKNNLKQNFRDLRTFNGWDIVDVPPSKGAKEAGGLLMERGEELQRERFVSQVCSAPAISSDDYTKLRAKSEKGTMFEVEVAAMRRYEIEHFYLCPVSAELLALDKNGKYRNAVRLFELMTRSEQEARAINFYAKAEMAVDRNEPVERRRGLVDAFTAAGLFVEGKGFDRNVVITHESLSPFVEAVRGRNTSFQRLLDRTVRRDIEQKPAQQLGELLRLVGLSLSKVATKRQGDTKIYSYRINAEQLDAIEQIAANRRKHTERGDASDNDAIPQPSGDALQKAIIQAVAELKSRPKKKARSLVDELLGDGDEESGAEIEEGEVEAEAST